MSLIEWADHLWVLTEWVDHLQVLTEWADYSQVLTEWADYSQVLTEWALLLNEGAEFLVTVDPIEGAEWLNEGADW